MQHFDSGTILAIVFLALVAIAWIYSKVRRHQAHSWPAADGKVESCEAKFESTGYDPETHITTKKWVARMKYSYAVEGATHSGNYRRNFNEEEDAQEWMVDYKAGQALIIRYHPKNHASSEFFEKEQPWQALKAAS
jgi:Protein of unknown function (DUF3592)